MRKGRELSVSRQPVSFIEKIAEWLFALFLFAGYYKADRRVAFIQNHIDITILFLILSFCVLFYRMLKTKFALRTPIGFNKVAVLFILLILSLVGSLLYTDSRQYGYDKVFRFIFITGWAFFGAGLLITDFHSLKRFSWATVVISTLMAIDALANYQAIGRVGFITALGSNYIALARACGLGFLVTVAFILPIKKSPLMNPILWIMAVLQLWAALIAGARGPVLALILSLALFLILSVNGRPFIRIDRYAIRLGVVILCALIILGVGGEELFPTLMFRTQVLLTEVGSSALTRISFNREALELWARSPIWGHGVGQFSVAVAGLDIREYPHNIILELGAETGLIGTLIFLAMILTAFAIPIITRGKQKGLAKVVTRYLLVAGFFAFVNSMVSGDINDNRMLFTWIALIATVHMFQRGKTESSSNSFDIGTSKSKELLGEIQEEER
ncbi:MAG: O-antigen ligase family protein [Candidatus Saccharicenans sp.]|nr:O-antigen ligase family protein [Candidatus Saccharicenans sp.]